MRHERATPCTVVVCVLALASNATALAQASSATALAQVSAAAVLPQASSATALGQVSSATPLQPVSSAAIVQAPRSGNPVLSGWYADPEAHVFNGEYWIFPTYSAPYNEQTFLDAFSSPDLITWTKHPRVLDAERVSWAHRALWAPSIIEKDGWYYLFFGANDIQNDEQLGGIGVARARSPAGPFEDHLGRPLIDAFHNGAQPIDQFVFRDVDGAYYIVYGGWRHCNIARLNDDFSGFIPFPDGSTFKEITPEGYVEGAFMLLKDGRYYFMWSEGGWTGPDYAVAYAIGDSPLGPFQRIGRVLQQDPEVATGAGHHSVLHSPASDRWYIVYHRRPLGETDRNHRVVSIDRLQFDERGSIQPVKITNTGVPADPLPTGGSAGGARPVSLSSGATPADSLYHEARPAMGTTADIRLYAANGARASELFDVVFAEIERIEDALSSYRPDSELSRINREAGKGAVTTDPEIFALLQRAMIFSGETGGAFDITVGPLVKTWGFFGTGGQYPSAEAIHEARERTGWSKAVLNAGDRSIRFTHPGMELDVGGIGKGWALDSAARLLRSLGIRNALLGLGQSSYLALGAPPDAPGWAIHVPDPESEGAVLSTVYLRDRALSTSGSAGRYFERDGRRYGHILDPRTGMPAANDVVQVTVTAATATDCDALSTALFVLGAAEAGAVMEDRAETGALLVLGGDSPRRLVAIRWPLEP